jgi:hypothetical protein
LTALRLEEMRSRYSVSVGRTEFGRTELCALRFFHADVLSKLKSLSIYNVHDALTLSTLKLGPLNSLRHLQINFENLPDSKEFAEVFHFLPTSSCVSASFQWRVFQTICVEDVFESILKLLPGSHIHTTTLTVV